MGDEEYHNLQAHDQTKHNCNTRTMRGEEFQNLQPHDQTKYNRKALVGRYRHIKRIFLGLAGLNIVLITVCIASLVYVTIHRSDSGPVTSDADIRNILYDIVSTDSVASIVQTQIFCLLCKSVKEPERHFFESTDGKRCCIENISTLLRLLKYTFEKGLNRQSAEVRSLKSSIDELKGDIYSVETILYNLNRSRSNLTEELTDTPAESLIRAKVEKNNRLINTVLNYRRSVLHLTGTANSSRLVWETEVKEGSLSFDTDTAVVHIHGGGNYLVYCNVHFTKKVCDGNENFGYHISQEYIPGEFFPVAHAQKACLNGSSIDTGLFLQTVISGEHGQNRALKVQYDSNNHRFISKTYKLHTFGFVEI